MRGGGSIPEIAASLCFLFSSKKMSRDVLFQSIIFTHMICQTKVLEEENEVGERRRGRAGGRGCNREVVATTCNMGGK